MYAPLAANEWGKRLERVMDWADELGATETITPRLKLKHQETLEEIHKLHVFLEGLEFLLGGARSFTCLYRNWPRRKGAD